MGAVTPTDWERALGAALGVPVSVRYGRARRTVVRARREGGRMLVTLNEVFAQAPPGVRDALGAWLRAGRRARRASAELDRWIERSLAELHARAPEPLALRTAGAHHDLAALAADLLARELRADFAPPAAPPRITWGRAARSRSRRSLRLGSFDYAARVVRIHPVLDQAAVPASFVRYVLFHELLHAALGEHTHPDGRRAHHGPAFKAREQAYPGLAAALAWERTWIDALIRSARTGKPLRAPAARPAKLALPEAARTARSPARKPGWVQGLLFPERAR